MGSHDFYDLFFKQPRLCFYVIKTGVVIPSHSDDFRGCQSALIRARDGRDEIIGEFTFTHFELSFGMNE